MKDTDMSAQTIITMFQFELCCVNIPSYKKMQLTLNFLLYIYICVCVCVCVYVCVCVTNLFVNEMRQNLKLPISDF